MASSKEFLNVVLDQLSGLEGLSYRPMMGEYLLYCNGKIVADICDNRLLVKPTDSAKLRLPTAPLEAPYPGAKEMLLVEDVEDGDFLKDLFVAIADQLPPPKPKKKRPI